MSTFPFWRFILLSLSTPFVTGCGGASLLQYELDTPVTLLTLIGATPVQDRRAEFRYIFCGLIGDAEDKCDSLLHRISDEPVTIDFRSDSYERSYNFKIFFVPGLFGDCIDGNVLPFFDAYERLEQLNHSVSVIRVSGRSSSAHNAQVIFDTVMRSGVNLEDTVLLVGHSKGVTDILHALVNFPEIGAYIDAVVSVAGVVNGTPLADGVSDFLETSAGRLPYWSCPVGDGMGIASLKRSYLLPWLSKHVLPTSVLYLSIGSFAVRENISSGLRSSHKRLSRVDPRNDSQVIYYDQIVPGSHLLGFANADHWAVALPFNSNAPLLAATMANKNDFPRTIMLEAILLYVANHLNHRNY